MANWLSRGGNTSSRDEAAGQQAGEDVKKFGRLVSRTDANGQTGASKNITRAKGRGDSPEELGEVKSRFGGGGKGKGGQGQSK
ncbi:hypothetical protein [Kribbella soli]|uniref:Uncharacterized protein n=1 Tax=Kribbella soli TaxID=1124743 RepID=A0A4R0HLM9_9ACTN|nr:hypothetical protein [Kribbella soli]TCC11503.1 hypothetical protein E0H45_09590 [Kribbella soli]